jgi:hypothetical protein
MTTKPRRTEPRDLKARGKALWRSVGRGGVVIVEPPAATYRAGANAQHAGRAATMTPCHDMRHGSGQLIILPSCLSPSKPE